MHPRKSIKTKFRSRLHGILESIPYAGVRNPSGNWTAYYGKWENQRKNWIDLQICWNTAGVEVLETNLQFLKATNRFSKEDIEWFKAHNYIDKDGDFFLSRRWIATLSGVRDTGNDEAEYWRLTCKYGAIPDSLFTYVENEDYFDESKITEEMKTLGKEFLKRVDIRYGELGKRWSRRDIYKVRTALFEGPLQIGVPVPLYSSWNQSFIKWDGSKVPAHSVEVRAINEKGEWEIFDSYNPNLKTLSSDYYVPIITRVVVNPKNPAIPNPVSQDTLWAKIWTAIAVYFGFNAKDSQVSA